MSRYREGIPAEQLAQVSDEMTAVTALMGMVFGGILSYWGVKSGLWWLRIWGPGLVLAGLAYEVYYLFYR